MPGQRGALEPFGVSLTLVSFCSVVLRAVPLCPVNVRSTLAIWRRQEPAVVPSSLTPASPPSAAPREALLREGVFVGAGVRGPVLQLTAF